MSGKSVFLKIVSFLFLIAVTALAAEPSLKARVVEDEAAVMKDPDFDSPKLGTLKRGTEVLVSKQVYGAFHRIFLGPGKIGYVSDVDVRVAGGGAKGKSAKAAKASATRAPRTRFENMNFYGFDFGLLRFREDTLGQRPTDNRTWFGFRASGPQVLIEGITTDFKILVAPGAPRYYEQATGRSADGFIFLLEGLMVSNLSVSPGTLFQFGFGPFFKYSKFNVTLVANGKDEPYSIDDMALGAVFQLGVAQRIAADVAFRLDLNYHWERMQYYGIGSSVQFHF